MIMAEVVEGELVDTAQDETKHKRVKYVANDLIASFLQLLQAFDSGHDLPRSWDDSFLRQNMVRIRRDADLGDDWTPCVQTGILGFENEFMNLGNLKVVAQNPEIDDGD